MVLLHMKSKIHREAYTTCIGKIDPSVFLSWTDQNNENLYAQENSIKCPQTISKIKVNKLKNKSPYTLLSITKTTIVCNYASQVASMKLVNWVIQHFRALCSRTYQIRCSIRWVLHEYTKQLASVCDIDGSLVFTYTQRLNVENITETNKQRSKNTERGMREKKSFKSTIMSVGPTLIWMGMKCHKTGLLKLAI